MDYFSVGELADTIRVKKDKDELNPIQNLEHQLFGKKGIKETIDEYEERLGLRQEKVKPVNVKFHNKIFCPSREEDEELLNELLNNPARFNIVMYKDTWTVHGDYRIFMIYSENLDDNKEHNKKEHEKSHE